MIIEEIQTHKIKVTSEIKCDICGESCKEYEGIVDNDVRSDHDQKFYDFEYMTLKANWGYYSGKDTQTWEAQVCEKCVDEKLSFIKFKKTNYL